MSFGCCVCFSLNRITARFTCGHFSWCQTCEVHLRPLESLLCTVCSTNKSIVRFPVQNNPVQNTSGPPVLDNQQEMAHFVLQQPVLMPGGIITPVSNQNCFFCWIPNLNTKVTSCLHLGWCERCSLQMQHETTYRCPYCQRDRAIVSRSINNQMNQTATILTIQPPTVATSSHVADPSRRHSSNPRLQQVGSILVRDSGLRYRLPNAAAHPLNEISLPEANAISSAIMANVQRDALGNIDVSIGINSPLFGRDLEQSAPPVQNRVPRPSIKCSICFRHERHVITSCGHIGWCSSCAQQYVSSRRHLCPMCDTERPVVPVPSSSNSNSVNDTANVNRKRKVPESSPPREQQLKVDADLSEDLAQTCCVCLENDRDTAFNPCGHRCVCSHCAREVFVKKRVCPVCQSSAISYLRIYL